jgi:hypothetical protein
MSRRMRKRLVSWVVVVALAFATPTSSKAVLPELIVGGSLLLQIGGIVVQSLPQLVAVGTGVLTLLKQGQDIGATIGRILGIHPSSDKPKDKPATPATPPTPTPTAKAQPTHTAPVATTPVAPKPADLDGMIRAVVQAFYQRLGLQEAAAKLAQGSPEREALKGGLSDVNTVYETAASALSEYLMDAVQAGDDKLVLAFTKKVEGLQATAQVAVAPVFALLVDKGARFEKLYGGDASSKQGKAFQVLADAYRRMTE